jgi:antitoxin component of MazEF toxin-antitoxin module
MRIGKSKSVGQPKTLIAKAGLTNEVEISARNCAIVISPASQLREGWAQAAERARKLGEDGLIDPPTYTGFDYKEWEWERVAKSHRMRTRRW